MEHEFTIKKANPKTAKERFLKQVVSKDVGKFAKSVYDTAEKLNSFKGPGGIAQLIEAGLHYGWFLERCDCCGEWQNKVISFDVNGGEYDYDVCAECLRGALIELEKA